MTMPSSLRKALDALTDNIETHRRSLTATGDQVAGVKDSGLSTSRSSTISRSSTSKTASTSTATLPLFPSLSQHQQLVHLSVTATTSPHRKRRISSLKRPAPPPSSATARDQPPSVLVVCPTPPAPKGVQPTPLPKAPAPPKMPARPASQRQLPTPPEAPSCPAIPGAPKFSLPNHVAIHPEFNGTGDVLIVCKEGTQEIGFLVNGSMMRMASPMLTTLLDQCAPTSPKVLPLPDSVHDMYAFLRLLRLASPGDKAYPPPFDPTISQCAGIHALTQKYDGWYPRAVLDFHVELHASNIVDRLGPNASRGDVFMLLRLAHALHSSFLWAQVCDRLRIAKWWHDILNPWLFTPDDIAALGQSIHSILSILASVSSRERLFSHLDELCVLYTEDGDVSVAAAERSSACCPCAAAVA